MEILMILKHRARSIFRRIASSDDEQDFSIEEEDLKGRSNVIIFQFSCILLLHSVVGKS
jgi:hypothetical protein